MILKPLQKVLAVIDQQLRKATAREERKANRKFPIGLGAFFGRLGARPRVRRL